jgi:hypothetical protein
MPRLRSDPGGYAIQDNLRDKIFFAAPVVWTMRRCACCGGGYLDPRSSKVSALRTTIITRTEIGKPETFPYLAETLR